MLKKFQTMKKETNNQKKVPQRKPHRAMSGEELLAKIAEQTNKTVVK